MGYDEKDRKRAAKLGAADATELVSRIKGLGTLLKKSQMEHLQKVLDAAMLNPVLKQEANAAYQDSIVARSGALVMRDPDKERIADRKAAEIIPISDKDMRIKLDFKKMLTADALTPRTNNPDEADYLLKVKLQLEHHGVWLRFGQPYASNPQDPNQMIHDPTQWEIWLSLGYGGDPIRTGDHLIDREELLQTTMLGAGYYQAVLTGTVQTKNIANGEKLASEIEAGKENHQRLLRNRSEAFPGVAEASEWVAGKVYGDTYIPPRTIWNNADKYLLKCYDYNAAGDVITAQAFLLKVAYDVMDNITALGEYERRVMTAAGSLLRVIKAVDTVADIVETALILTGAGLVTKGTKAIGKAYLKDQVEDRVRDKLGEGIVKHHN